MSVIFFLEIIIFVKAYNVDLRKYSFINVASINTALLGKKRKSINKGRKKKKENATIFVFLSHVP